MVLLSLEGHINRYGGTDLACRSWVWHVWSKLARLHSAGRFELSLILFVGVDVHINLLIFRMFPVKKLTSSLQVLVELSSDATDPVGLGNLSTMANKAQLLLMVFVDDFKKGFTWILVLLVIYVTSLFTDVTVTLDFSLSLPPISFCSLLPHIFLPTRHNLYLNIINEICNFRKDVFYEPVHWAAG